MAAFEEVPLKAPSRSLVFQAPFAHVQGTGPIVFGRKGSTPIPGREDGLETEEDVSDLGRTVIKVRFGNFVFGRSSWAPKFWLLDGLERDLEL